MISTLGWTGFNAFSSPSSTMVGASGAVMAAITLYTLYYPRREILFYFVPMPMWLVLAIFLLGDFFLPGRRVAWEAHLIGAGFAWAFKHFDLRWSRLISGRFHRPRLRIVTPVSFDQSRSRAPSPGRMSGEGVSGKASTVSVLPEEQLDARLDEVLAKIAREGRAGLTEEDHRVLQEASRRARNKRSDRL
jgi:hypothetical protein